MSLKVATWLMVLSGSFALTAGCEDPAADAAAQKKQELEGLKQQILEAGAVQEKRANDCVATIRDGFNEAVGDERGAFNKKPEGKMGVGVAFAVDAESIGKLIEGVQKVSAGQACEPVNESYFKIYKQGKWPDDRTTPERRHEHATKTLAELKEKPPSPPAAVAAYWWKCDAKEHKVYRGQALHNFDCQIQVVWLDSSGNVLAAAAGKGKGTQGSAPTTISEQSLKDFDEKVREVALTEAAQAIAKQQADW